MDKRKIELKTSVGDWEITKPKAGVRNGALDRAETDTGFKRMVFLTTILPKCISRRPDNFDKDVPMEQVLNDLEIEDYDILIDGLGKLLDPASYEKQQEIKN
jgi:hypothetical protein